MLALMMPLVLGKLIFWSSTGKGKGRSRNGSGVEDGGGLGRHFAFGLGRSDSGRVSAEEGAQEGVVHEGQKEGEAR